MVKVCTQKGYRPWKQVFPKGEIWLHPPYLVIVAQLDSKLSQMDVKIAVLNGELDEEIYMDQPVGL